MNTKSNVAYVSDATFQAEVIDNDAKVLVDFFADWCGPCKAIAPELDKLSIDSGVKIVKVNVDENPSISAKYGIRSIPTLHLFENGKVTGTVMGADMNGIKDLIK